MRDTIQCPLEHSCASSVIRPATLLSVVSSAAAQSRKKGNNWSEHVFEHAVGSVEHDPSEQHNVESDCIIGASILEHLAFTSCAVPPTAAQVSTNGFQLLAEKEDTIAGLLERAHFA